MRSGNLADEHAMHDLQQMAAVERAVNKARGITSAADAENEHEKSAHRDTQEALEESERSVSSFVPSTCIVYLSAQIWIENNSTWLRVWGLRPVRNDGLKLYYFYMRKRANPIHNLHGGFTYLLEVNVS